MRLWKPFLFFIHFIKAFFCHSQDLLKGHHQLLMSTTSNWEEHQGNLQLFEREDDNSAWTPVGDPMPVVLGRTGLAWGIGLHPKICGPLPDKREGDGKSPAGIFTLGCAFGFSPISEMGHLKVEYLYLDEYIEAVDDSLSCHYNCIVDTRKTVPDWHSSEKMGKEALYEVGVVVHHNFPEPQTDAGSAIFLHIWRHNNLGTAGCTAMSREHLNLLLSWLEKDKNPVLIQLPISEYNRLQTTWNLPAASP